MKKSSIIHYPNLQTVLMVEEVLKREKDITRTGLKEKLPKKVMHQTLNVIIKYLEDSGKVIDHKRRILWTYASPEEMERILKNTRDMSEVLRELEEKHNKRQERPGVREKIGRSKNNARRRPHPRSRRPAEA